MTFYPRSLSLVSVISIILFVGSSCYDVGSFLKNYPTPFSSNNRILGFVLAFNLEHLDSLMMIINEYTSMCEGGWNSTLVVYTGHDWSDKMRRYARYRTYCYRIDAYMPIRYSVHNYSVGTALSAYHRKYIAAELNNFDVFAYHEDDIVLKHTHMNGYLDETRRLATISPNLLLNHLIGFMRYRRIRQSGSHVQVGGAGGTAEDVVLSIDLQEERPELTHVCKGDGSGAGSGSPYISVKGDVHQGGYILTREQVKYLGEKCHFLDHFSSSRDYMSSYSLYDSGASTSTGNNSSSSTLTANMTTVNVTANVAATATAAATAKPVAAGQYEPTLPHCNMQKIIPGESFSAFYIYHYYPSEESKKDAKPSPIFKLEEEIRAGFNRTVPPCWTKLTTAYAAEQLKPPSNHSAFITHDGGHARRA